MKRMKRRTLLRGLTLLPAALLTGCGLQAETAVHGMEEHEGDGIHFTVENQSGLDIFTVRFKATAAPAWSEDVLGDDFLLQGEKIEVHLPDRFRLIRYDMLISNELGQTYTFFTLHPTGLRDDDEKLCLQMIDGKLAVQDEDGDVDFADAEDIVWY